MAASLFSTARWQLTLLGLLATSLLAGCGAVSTTPSRSSSEAAAPQTGETFSQTAQSDAGMDAAVPSEATAGGAPAVALPQASPQLVKQAKLTLILDDVDEGTAAATQIAQQLQGDILTLEDWQPQQLTAPRQVNLTLRLPQQNLEAALDQIRQLGDIQQQSVTAEDVSDQLVDLSARLRNLRQSEAALLKIMDRSGKIPEVLEVSRELSTVRESIERLAAQQQQLNQQVTYSTITLTLTSAIATTPNPRPLGETVSTSWQAATQSVGTFTVGLLKISLWLLAYSPYLALIAGIAFGGYRWQRRTGQPVVVERVGGE
ncbi:MAG: DUF4349 domain-containing protein [Cyanobacteria bacterium Co-bin8]|nr:DUF4349 domain-containing protein [Cyanobacteria bacterium Co-bin8]